ncbi:hypothetical protein [Paragemmobacter straminiformis]|uniref:Threonine/homoserine/homoserine lactone efflux protein n=1 Tax=Paragemmobacter straminiformis TaxID=2045119 RepID=A0A842I8U1_9RHOB|nr:hypothetical protein [Gemmobacter straminiformis]MBC2835484.1 hypothetical protein [Gemmobacter straminiformis]
MPTPEIALAILLLLLTPGPTNTLMMLSGADRGLRASLPLIPVELAAYLCTVVPLTLLAHAASPWLGALRPAIAIIAGLWVLSLAIRLWHVSPHQGDRPLVSPARVFVTTLLNPKALIFGLVLLPATAPAQGFALFTALVVLVAVAWVWIGQRLPSAAGTGLALMRRAAACWLGLLSLGLLAKGFGA